MARIILTSNYSPWSRYSGGGQKSTHMLACSYAQLGHDVHVIFSKAPWQSIAAPANLPYTLHWAIFFAVKPGISSPLRWLNVFSFRWKAKRIVQGAEILIGSGEEFALLGTLPNIQKSIYINRYPNPANWLSKIHWHSFWGRTLCFVREPRFAMMGLCCKNSNYLACTSKSSAGQFEKSFATYGKNVAVIPNGIDRVFLQCPIKSAAGNGVFFFGRLTLAKGIQELLTAWSQLPEHLRQQHPLTIVGQGPLGAEVKAFANQNTGVTLYPWLPPQQIADIMRENRIAVLPSHEESFGNTMLESLAVGLSLITCASGSIPEVVGNKAIMVPAKDIGALQNAMLQQLQAPYNAMDSIATREYVLKEYSWNATAQRLLDL